MILLGEPICSIQMLSLLETPYNLVQGAQIKVRITAANVLGLGYTSLVSTSNVQVRVLPKKPFRDTYRGYDTSPTQIEVKWDLLDEDLENGGSEILSYNLQWDAGNGLVNVNLVGWSTPYLHSSFIVTSGVTAGALYKFKYRARNVYGWGPFSEEVTIKAAR
jgi:hypothetical protein